MRERILAIVFKEFRHITRDWQTLMIVLAMPVVMMFLYGYALNMDIREVPVVIEDPAGSPEVRRIAGAIDGTVLFRVSGTVRSAGDVREMFRRRHVKALFRFPPDFSAKVRRGGAPAPVQVLIDGSDPNMGTILRAAAESLLLKAVLDVLGIERPEAVTVHQRVLYNVEQRSALYIVPGLMAVILLMISALLTSLAITREKELGTMEQLLVSPLRPREIILGKIIPYIGLAAADGVLVLLVGYAAFGVRVAGSLLLLAAISFIYIFCALAIGLLISTLARTQQQAMLMVIPATLLPTIILSGFIFPVDSMPVALRCISYIVPATWFLRIIRAIILKGAGLLLLLQPLAVLCFIGAALTAASVRKFRVRL
jgi:ABC-2 type transport system permease protein